MARVLRNVAGTVVMIVLTQASAWAQATGQMSGTVRDASGAVLPGVTITVTQTDTGFTRTVVTEGGGTYVVPNLPTGPYKLDASLQGFRSYSQTGIVLQVNGNPTINVTLAIGDVAETISVEGAAPLVGVRQVALRVPGVRHVGLLSLDIKISPVSSAIHLDVKILDRH